MTDSRTRSSDERLASGECSDELRKIVAVLRRAAVESGDDVAVTESGSEKGWGLVYKRGRRVICRLDPKPMKDHVCVCIPGADDAALNLAGTVHPRKNESPWVDVRSVADAERLVGEVRHAYAGAGDALQPQAKVVRRN